MGLLVSGLALFMIEVFARVAHTLGEDARRIRRMFIPQWFVYLPDVGWDRKPEFKGFVGHGDREFDERGYFTVDSAQVKDTKPKVMFLGDSNTFGFGVPTRASFVEVADDLLPEVDAINLGVLGTTSYQGRIALSKYLPILKPQAVVVSYGFNDRRYVLTKDEVDSAEHFRRVWASQNASRAIAEVLEVSYLYRGVRSLMTMVGLLPGNLHKVRLDTVVPRVDEKSYRENLAEMAQESQRLGIPLIFVLLRDNPLQTRDLERGISNWSRGDYAAAVTDFQAAIDLDNEFADLARIYLAKAYEAQGYGTQARDVLVSRTQRSLHGGLPVRLDRDYSEIMRQVAAEYNLKLVDAGQVLDEHPSQYIDEVHFNSSGHRRVGELLAHHISEVLGDHPCP